MLSIVCTGYLLGAGDMTRSEARILLIGSDLGQGLSSVAVCRVQMCLCLACGRAPRGACELRRACVYSCLRMINERGPTHRGYTDAWRHMRYVVVKN